MATVSRTEMARVLNDSHRRVCLLALAVLLLAACGDDDDNDDGPATGDASAVSQTGDASAVTGSPAEDGGAEPGGDQVATDAGVDGSDAQAADDEDRTGVSLDDGELQGDVVGGAVLFLKIPYAEPPVGPMRWKAPQPNEPWTGVRHEAEFATGCPQAASQQSPESTNEDCLYLNVWRPDSAVQDAPVMVWIHGGGFTTGSAGDMVPLSTDHLWYDGRYFAERHGIVVVTINYRLGAMGFFAHPALADEGSPVGNQGLLDQQLALNWVQDNIAAFGGDPGNVTIFGQSAGAGSVCMHLVSPGSRGLFHRAISQSGGCTTRRSTDRDELDAQHEQFAAERGCEGDDVLACLRDKPVDEIVNLEPVDRTAGFDRLRRSFSFGAVVDGEGGFLPEPAIDLFERGEVAQVPYMMGATSEESQLYFLAAPVPETEEEYIAEITDTYGDFAERVLEMYPLSKFDGDIRKAMARISTDSGMFFGTVETARRAVEAGLPVYMYNYNIPWSIVPDLLGPCHASEISHVFGSPYNESEENIEVADVMNEYWANFARNGDPNYEDAPAVWPRFEPDENGDDLRIQFDPDFDILESFRKEECTLWREYAEQQAS